MAPGTRLTHTHSLSLALSPSLFLFLFLSAFCQNGREMRARVCVYVCVG